MGLVTGFAGYAFCKAHSTAYGVEAYQAAWLKCYHPAEFMAAVLTNGKGFYQPLVYVLESRRLGLQFLPPTVNEPGPKFTVHGIAIRIPLTRTKGLSDKTTRRIVVERERKSFDSMAGLLKVQVAPALVEVHDEVFIMCHGCSFLILGLTVLESGQNPNTIESIGYCHDVSF